MTIKLPFWWRVRPETSFIFILLLGTGICLVLFYIYPIPPYAPAFLHIFLLLVTVVKGKDPKRHLYLYSVVLEFSSAFLHSSCYTWNEALIVARLSDKWPWLGIGLGKNWIIRSTTSYDYNFTKRWTPQTVADLGGNWGQLPLLRRVETGLVENVELSWCPRMLVFK